MKIPIWIIFGLLISVRVLFGQDANGLLIYSDPPSSYLETCEYRSLDAGKPVYSTVIKINGQKFQVKTGGTWIVVEYPPIDAQTIKSSAGAHVDEISRLISQYPQFRNQLIVAQTKWQNALAFANQVPHTTKAEPQTLKNNLTVDGIQYDDSKLTSVNVDSVGISYANGAATIPLAKLSKDQIISLNATSASVQIDPNWKPKSVVAPIQGSSHQADSIPNPEVKQKPSSKGIDDASLYSSVFGIFGTSCGFASDQSISSSEAQQVGPEFKGFQLGMKGEEAITNVNGLAKGKIICGKILDLYRKNPAGMYHSSPEVKFCPIFFYSEPDKQLLPGGYIGFDEKGLLVMVHLSPQIVRIIFNSSDLGNEEFAQKFVDTYGIPKLIPAGGHLLKYTDADEGWGINMNGAQYNGCEIDLFTIKKADFN